MLANKLPEQIIVDIIKNYMSLGDNNVWVRDQSRKIPADNGIYVVVGVTLAKFIPNTSFALSTEVLQRVAPDVAVRIDADGDVRIDATGDTRTGGEGDPDDRITAEGDNRVTPVETLKETNQVVGYETIQIDVLSRDPVLLGRRWEAIAALSSLYAKMQQENNTFKIFRVPTSFVNTSSAEGGSNINRFTTAVSTNTWYQKEKVISSDSGDYYNDFHQRVDDEPSIETPHGIVEFEISAKNGVN